MGLAGSLVSGVIDPTPLPVNNGRVRGRRVLLFFDKLCNFENMHSNCIEVSLFC